MIKKMVPSIQKLILIVMLGLILPAAWGLTLQEPKAMVEEKATRILIPVDDTKMALGDIQAQKNIVFFDIENAVAKRSRMFIYVQSSTVVKVVVSQYQSGENPIVRVVLFFAPGVKISQAKQSVKPIIKDGQIEILLNHDLSPAPVAAVATPPANKAEPKPAKPEPKPETVQPPPASPAKPALTETTLPAAVETTQPTPPPAKTEPAPVAAKNPKEPIHLKVTKYKPIDTPVTANFTDTELSNVIRSLAAQCGLNIYAAFRMNIKVTLQAKDEPVGKVIKNILNTNGYTYELLGENTLKIVEIKEGMPEYAPATDILPTKVYTVNFYKAPEIKEAIDKLLKNSAPPKIAPGMSPVSSQVTAVTSILAVTAPPEVLKQVEALIQQAENKNP